MKSARFGFWSLVFALPVYSLLAGCSKQESKNTPAPPADTLSRSLPQLAAKPVPSFSGENAMTDVMKQMSFGPRVPNTPAHEKAVEYFRNELARTTTSLELQKFDVPGYGNTSLPLTNLIASFNPAATDRILILTHFDSRPWATEDPNPANKVKPVPAANDGASGSAILLELAKIFKDDPPPIGVDLLFDDGEDYGKSEIDNLDHYFLGVKYYVSHKSPDYHPRFAILLDMVGDKNASFKMEANSLRSAPQFTHEIWNSALELGFTSFQMGQGMDIEDDHLPLIDAGIPSVDIIDAELVGHTAVSPDRKYWHTIDDLPKHLSSQTMADVGKLLLNLIYDKLPKDIRNL